MRFVLVTDLWLLPTSSGDGTPDPPPSLLRRLLVVDSPSRRRRRPIVDCCCPWEDPELLSVACGDLRL